MKQTKRIKDHQIKTIKSHDSILIPLLGRGVFTAGFAPPRPYSVYHLYLMLYTTNTSFCILLIPHPVYDLYFAMYTVVVVVVFFILTDRASTIPRNIRGCQSRTWSQRGTKVNGSHHGDNPLLRPTGIQIATKSYATLHTIAPANNKTVHQTSFTPY